MKLLKKMHYYIQRNFEKRTKKYVTNNNNFVQNNLNGWKRKFYIKKQISKKN